MTIELYLSNALYRAHVQRLLPIAGTGDADQIKKILAPLFADRLNRLADVLSHLGPDGWTGEISENQITIALGEHGDIWPRGILGDVAFADIEDCRKRERAQTESPAGD
jgi:ribosomal protein S28E/S33